MKINKTNSHLSSDEKNFIGGIKKIISVPRSNSTIIELILGSSKSVYKIIHEPFHEFGYYNADSRSSFDKIIKTAKENKTFVLKDMSQWIIQDMVYEELLSNSRSPIILLIKNPFLSIESKIIKILEGVDKKERPELISHILRHFKISDNNKLNTKDVLNLFALKNGYSNWKYFLKKEGLLARNYAAFDQIIQFFDRSEFSDVWGWKSMNTIKKYLDKHKIRHKILDGIDFQILPKATIVALCRILSISFDDGMFNFSPKKFKGILDIGKLQPDGQSWYKEAFSNSNIYTPKSSPVKLVAFPKFVQNYIKRIALPVYNSLCLDSQKIDVLKYSDNRTYDFKLIKSYSSTDNVYYGANKKVIMMYGK